MPLNTALKLDQPFTPNPQAAAKTASAVALLWLVLEARRLLMAHRREVMSVALWKHTEAAAAPPCPKYRLRYRTRAAMDLTTAAEVRHEHVWTREWLIDTMLERHRHGWTEADLARFVEQHAVACTVTVDEHQRLEEHEGREGWNRYAAAGIAVWDCQEGVAFVLPEHSTD